GDAQVMRDFTQGGNDVLIGGDNHGSGSLENDLFGDAVLMFGSSRGGNDTLIAGTSSAGGTIANFIWGDAFVMSGTASGGHDTFGFRDNVAAGQTVGTNNFVGDFSQLQHDLIEFSGVAGVNSFADLSFDTVTDPGSTIIHAGSDQVTLVGF